MKFLAAFLFLFLSSIAFGQVSTNENASKWSDVIESKKGTIVFYWYPSHPFIYSENNKILGIEYELGNSFVEYLETEYAVDLEVKWIQADKFDDIIYKLKDFDGGVFGCASLSITEERSEILEFTPPYAPDIAVLISSSDIPLARTKEEFYSIFDGLTAVALRNTTFESELIKMRDENPIDYQIEYINDLDDVLKALETKENAFGYIDLPSFLIAMNDKTAVKRQFFYPIKLKGLSFIYPMQSDWQEPVNDYFNSSKFAEDQKIILTKYLGNEVHDLMNRISKSAEIGPYEEIVILTKEKEFQYKELLDNAKRAQSDQKTRNVLIGSVVFVLLIATIFYGRGVIKAKANRQLAIKQKQIEQKNKELFELNQQKNNLINVLAHDLRSPIHQILGLAQMHLRENKDMEEEQQKIIQYIVDSSNRLSDLISKILDVEAIETQQLNVKIEKINFHNLIENVVSRHSEPAEIKKIKLVKNYMPSLSSVNGDTIYLTQVIDNLVSNAIKFSKQNTTVSIEIKESEEHLTVCVADQGPGFTDEDKQNLFKKFQQLSAKPTGGEQSTGLGLSIVKMYTDLMKGSISCQSEVGKGTTFEVTLSKAV